MLRQRPSGRARASDPPCGPRLLIGGARAAPALAAGFTPSHIVVLRSPGSPPPDGLRDIPAAGLELVFHDIVAPREGLAAPAREDVERLLDFADGWTGARAMLVCCYAGVSRSPAAAYAIACLRHGAGAGAEATLARALRSASPCATPNAAMVAFADAVLGREGRMIEAISAIGRGADAFEGGAFAWDLASGAAQGLAAAPSSTAASQSCSTAPSTSPV